MTTLERLFQDPLLAHFHKILANDSQKSWSAFLATLSKELQHARHRVQKATFTRQADPIITAVNRVFRNEKIQINWSRIAYLGCSAGGDVALRSLFQYLKYPHLPIVIVMHHNPSFRFMSRFQLADGIEQEPIIIEDGLPIKAGEIYFVPGEQLIGYQSNKSFKATPLLQKQRFRPLIDQVLKQAAQNFGDEALGVILSGMLNDGAVGLNDMYLNKCEIIVQDPVTAMFADMPKAAKSSVPSVRTLNLKQIAERLNLEATQFLTPRSLQPFFGGTRS